MNSHLTSKGDAARKAAFLLMSAVLLVCAIHLSAAEVSAQGGGHTVFVEGNCDSPVPGTTIVTLNTCGDFDGDGRIGTAEDTASSAPSTPRWGRARAPRPARASTTAAAS